MEISEAPKQDLGVSISWGLFTLSLCLHLAADQGQTAEEGAAANAVKRQEGEEKQRYLKIVEALKDHLKIHVGLS